MHRVGGDSSEGVDRALVVREVPVAQVLDRTSQLYRRYIEKLNEQETRLEEMGAELDALRIDLERKREAYRSYVSRLSVS